jgi:MFS family permease
VPSLVRSRNFNLYWFGLVASQIGTRAASVANLYQVYELTRSVPLTGLVGLSQGLALLTLSPLGGAYADRLDRRKLLQATQVVSLVVALVLAVFSAAGRIQVMHILVGVVLITAASTFDAPARQALIPALVPREQLPQAFALLNPSRELAFLIGPALSGLLIAASGPWLVYAVDAGTYAVLVVVLVAIRIPPRERQTGKAPLWSNIREGASYVRSRPLILQLMSLDLSCTLFAAYRVVLPALALDVLHVGPEGYGLLASAPSAGAVLATYFVFRVLGRSRRLGMVLLTATACYGVAAMVLAQAPVYALALAAAVFLGGFDAMATSVRHAAVQLETPDRLRGRVSSIYQMASRGGPALGDVNVGLVAGVVGPVMALTIGGVVPVLYAGALYLRCGRVAAYRGPRADTVVGAGVVDPPPDQELAAADPLAGAEAGKAQSPPPARP